MAEVSDSHHHHHRDPISWSVPRKFTGANEQLLLQMISEVEQFLCYWNRISNDGIKDWSRSEFIDCQLTGKTICCLSPKVSNVRTRRSDKTKDDESLLIPKIKI